MKGNLRDAAHRKSLLVAGQVELRACIHSADEKGRFLGQMVASDWHPLSSSGQWPHLYMKGNVSIDLAVQQKATVGGGTLSSGFQAAGNKYHVVGHSWF